MKHYRLLAVLVAVLGLLAAACGDDGDGGGDGGDTATPDTSDLPTEVGEGEGALNIIAWAGYIEDGSTEADIDWVTAFEEETGCAGRGDHRRHVRRDGLADDQQRVTTTWSPRRVTPACASSPGRRSSRSTST